MEMKFTFLLAAIFLAFAGLQADVIAEFDGKKEEGAAVLFGRLQEIRKEMNPDCGNIFITPGVAKRKSYRAISLKNQDEIKVMQYLCKIVNAGFYEDNYGNYYVVTSGEKFNRVKEGEWIPYPDGGRLTSNKK